MAEIVIDRPHGIGLDGAREAGRRIAQELTEQYDMDCHWEGDLLSFYRVGAHGTLELEPDRVRMVLKLGILLSAFKPAIEERLDRNFDRYFGPAVATSAASTSAAPTASAVPTVSTAATGT